MNAKAHHTGGEGQSSTPNQHPNSDLPDDLQTKILIQYDKSDELSKKYKDISLSPADRELITNLVNFNSDDELSDSLLRKPAKRIKCDSYKDDTCRNVCEATNSFEKINQDVIQNDTIGPVTKCVILKSIENEKVTFIINSLPFTPSTHVNSTWMMLQKINIPTMNVVFEPFNVGMGDPFGMMWTRDQVVPIINIFKKTFFQSQIVGKILEMTHENPDPEVFIERFDSESFVVDIVKPTI